MQLRDAFRGYEACSHVNEDDTARAVGLRKAEAVHVQASRHIKLLESIFNKHFDLDECLIGFTNQNFFLLATTKPD